MNTNHEILPEEFKSKFNAVATELQDHKKRFDADVLGYLKFTREKYNINPSIRLNKEGTELITYTQVDEIKDYVESEMSISNS